MNGRMAMAVILVGGLGTRLRTLYPDRPKALVPVAGRPYLDWLMDWLARRGVDRVHLAGGYRADALAGWLAGRAAPVPGITLSIEPERLGTGGGLKFVEPHIEGDLFLVLNGDSFLPGLDVPALLADADRHDADAVLAVTRIESAGRYGTVEFGADGRLTAFLEKADRQGGWVNGGVYAMRRAALGRLPAGRSSSLETDLFPALAREGRIRALPCPPPLLDMGTPEGLSATEDHLRRHGLD